MGLNLDLDHIVISAARLAEGVAHVEARLGVTMAPGGKHAAMGTHNALLHLGEAYLEVIAIDPDAPVPDYPRWFDLDNFAGPPRLTHWVARCADLAGVLTRAPAGAGQPMDLARGDLRWSMAVPADGRLPFDDAFPGLIQWHGTAHPAQRLPDAGCRLTRLDVSHPQAADLARFASCPGVSIISAGTRSLCAGISSPKGQVALA